MYICVDCGKIYEDEEVETNVGLEEYNEGYYGTPSPKFLQVDECASCGGNLEKAVECKKCGDFIASDKVFCESCLSNYETLDNALEIGADYKTMISLNGLFAFAFTTKEIEDILLEKLNESNNLKNIIKSYCEEDISYFNDFAEAKWKEEK